MSLTNIVFLKKRNMPITVKYLIDEKGTKTSVIVPLKVWEKINEDYARLQNKIGVLTGIKKGLKEVRDAKENGKELQTLNDLLRESNH